MFAAMDGLGEVGRWFMAGHSGFVEVVLETIGGERRWISRGRKSGGEFVQRLIGHARG